jgi:hypothetical protein
MCGSKENAARWIGGGGKAALVVKNPKNVNKEMAKEPLVYRQWAFFREFIQVD